MEAAMHCHDARLLLLFGQKRDELSAEDGAALEHHVQNCDACRRSFENLKREDAIIGRAMLAVPVPADAQARLLGEVRRRSRARQRWVLSTAAMAAAVFLAVAFGGYLWVKQPLTTSVEALRKELVERQVRTPERAAAWFAANGAAVIVPRVLRKTEQEFKYEYALNYELLDNVGFTRLQGLMTPHLTFRFEGDRNQPPAILHVYVLSNQQFDVASLKSTPSKPRYAGSLTMELLGAESPEFQYLVAYTSGDLLPFCKRRINN